MFAARESLPLFLVFIFFFLSLSLSLSLSHTHTHFLLALQDEAFDLWKVWADIYSDESESYELIHTVRRSYFLVSLIDNNFVNGNIFDIFDDAAPGWRSTATLFERNVSHTGSGGGGGSSSGGPRSRGSGSIGSAERSPSPSPGGGGGGTQVRLFCFLSCFV